MAEYRYLFYTWDYTLIDVLPVQSTVMTWPVSQPGTFTGQIPLRTPALPAGRVLPATRPFRTRLMIERDGALIWGGRIIAPRTWDSTGGLIAISAEETHGYLASRFVPTMRMFGRDQVEIAQRVIAAVQAVPRGDAGLTVTAVNGMSGVLRDGVYSKWDFTPALQALTDLNEMADGFEFAHRVSWVGGLPYEELLIAYPYLGRRRTASPLVIEHNEVTGGNVISYEWPDGPGLATRAWTSAKTPDGVQLVASKDNTGLYDEGYPLIEAKYDFSSSKPTTQALLQAYANRQAGWAAGNRVAAQFTIRPGEKFALGDAQAGDDVLVRITDRRFPAGTGGRPGFSGWMRVAQIQCNPDQNGLETLTVTTLDYTEPA